MLDTDVFVSRVKVRLDAVLMLPAVSLSSVETV